uniref:Uncharacterized protein n=1 Tax=Ciona savignyi TaxID=51511 RepID=H2ZPZ2_CIOSA
MNSGTADYNEVLSTGIMLNYEGYYKSFYYVNLAVILAISLCVVVTLLFLIFNLCLRMEALRQYWIKDSRWGKEQFIYGFGDDDSSNQGFPMTDIV